VASLGEADVVVGGVGTAGAAVGMGPKRLEDGTPVWLQPVAATARRIEAAAVRTGF